MRFTAKFVIAFALTAIIPIAILGYLSYNFAKQTLKQQILESFVLTAEAVEGHLYSFMEAIKGRAVDFSSDGFIRDSVKALQRLEAKNHPYEKTQRALIAHLKRNKKPLDKCIRLICVIDLNGRVIASTDEEMLGTDESKSEYFSNGMKDVYLSDVSVLHHHLAPNYPYYIAVSAPLTDKVTDNLLGVIVNFYETSELNKVLSGQFQLEHGALSSVVDRSKTLDIYLVNGEKLLITPSRSGGEVMKQKVEALPVMEGAKGRETKGIYRNYLGTEVIGASMFIPSKGWTLLLEIGTNEAFFPIAAMRNRIMILIIPIWVLAGFLAYFLSRESRGAVLAEKSRLEALVYGIKEGIVFTNAKDSVALINTAAEELLEMKAADCMGQPIHSCFQDTMKKLVRIPEFFREEKMKYHADEIIYKGRDFEVTASPIMRGGVYIGTVMVLRDITGRKRMEDELLTLSRAVEQSPATVVITDRKGAIEYVNPKFTRLAGYTLEEVLGQNPRILKSGKTSPEEYKQLWNTITTGREWQGEFLNKKKNGEIYWESATISPIKAPEGTITHFIAIKEDITERKQKERRLVAEHAVAQALAESATLDEASPKILQVLCEGLGWDLGGLWTVDCQNNVLRCVEIWHLPWFKVPEFEAITRKITFSPGVGLPGRVWASGKPAWIIDVTVDANFPRAAFAAKEGLHGAFCFPVTNKNEILGVMDFFSREVKQPDDELLNMMAAIGMQIGLFIKGKQSEEQTRLQLQRVSGLHDIDLAITGSLELRVSLGVFLDKAVTLLNLDAADVLLLDTHTQTLEYIAGRGFRTDAIRHSQLRLGEGTAGLAALERRFLCIPDLREASDTFVRSNLLAGEGFITYYAQPLIAKGCVKGVLEVFHRTPFAHNSDWLEFFHVIATQGAITIDNASLLNDLQRSNIEIVMAYDRTLEGWSRALDLRDKETEGHSQRVTEMTQRLMRAMGIGSAEMAHARRGALLHDIGKLGVPDSILLKPGPLTEEEWIVMRRHPEFANALLSPVTYLKHSIDIPYCHHEKWDGTGYPRGLKGEQIPLAARVFAVVDVWDALCSDRPYRKGWPEEKVREYICSCAGAHFDPEVVKVFSLLEKTG